MNRVPNDIEATPQPDVSILLPTRDRVALLAKCLGALLSQRTGQTFEVIVIDNAPEPGYSSNVVIHVPEVRTVIEPRQGLSYARNAGIRAARGRILVFTDDDAQPELDWLENLTRPFSERPNVVAVTGRTLPLKLETEAERLFEAYGGFDSGKLLAEFDIKWLIAMPWRLPLWQVGTTANAAFRKEIFQRPGIGLLDERLGAGSPVGAWEDLYLFYRILRAGHTILYQPSAQIRHMHRQSLAELSKQLEAYRRGEVAFCLLSLNNEREWRALSHLMIWIPYWRITQLLGELLRRLRGKKRFRFSIFLREWLAYVKGPFALFQSHRRVKRWVNRAPFLS